MRFSQIPRLAFALVLFSIPAFYGRDSKKDSPKNKESNLRAAEKVKKFAADKAKDPDFTDLVDQAYADLLREHTDRAYEVNTSRSSQIYAVHEDRFRIHTGLYDNLLVQDHINRIGQSLVPEKCSQGVLAFRLTPDPAPSAETLATGTIYISTGIVSLLDSEAQLAYVLAHEIAHVCLNHWREKVTMQVAADVMNAEAGKTAEKVKLIGSVAGKFTGVLGAKSATDAMVGAAAGAAGGALANSLLNRRIVVDWNKDQEDAADVLAFETLLGARYDVREIPKLYGALMKVITKDNRAQLGFLGERKRVEERTVNANILIANSKDKIDHALSGPGFLGDSPEHRNLMAELKVDNGISAYYHDMFGLARKNLEEAVSIRDNDPAAHYYYGKVLESIGRTPEDRRLAQQSFARAIQTDFTKENFGAVLHDVLSRIAEGKASNPEEVTRAFKTYVAGYVHFQLEYRDSLLLPPNINTVIEYMRKYGQVDVGDLEFKTKLVAEARGGQAAPIDSPKPQVDPPKPPPASLGGGKPEPGKPDPLKPKTPDGRGGPATPAPPQKKK